MALTAQKFLIAAATALLLALAPGALAGAETVREPSEGAFSIDLPRGWSHQVGLMGTPGGRANWVHTRSQDGRSEWFMNDRQLTFVVDPRGLDPFMLQAVQFSGQPVAPTPGIDNFLAGYVQRRYGNQGVRVVGTRPDHESARALQASLSQNMVPIEVTAGFIDFEVQTPQGPLYGRIAGTIMAQQSPAGQFWTPLVNGFLTPNDRDVEQARFEEAQQSFKLNPQWQAREQQIQRRNHQQQMAQNRQRLQNSQAAHQQRMASLNSNFQAHQRSMQQQSQIMDQSHANYMSRSNTTYQGQQDYVRGAIHERTLLGNGGDTQYEVDAGANYHYVNPLDNSYIGTETELDPGQVPWGYERQYEQ